MNVLQIFTNSHIESVVANINEIYPNDQTSVSEYAQQFLNKVKTKVLQRTDYKVEISHLAIKHDDTVDDDEHVDVSIVVDDISYAMALTPWPILLGCEVVCDIPGGLSIEQQAAYLYAELDCHGGEEGSIAVSDLINDRLEEFDQDKSGFTKINFDKSQGPDIWDVLFPECTEEQKEELRADSDKQLANSKTRKFYKNGILHQINFFNNKPVFEAS